MLIGSPNAIESLKVAEKIAEYVVAGRDSNTINALTLQYEGAMKRKDDVKIFDMLPLMSVGRGAKDQYLIAKVIQDCKEIAFITAETVKIKEN